MTEPATTAVAAEGKQTASGGRSRRLFRWLLVILAVAVATPLVIVGYRYRQQMDFIERLEARNGRVFTEPWGPRWVRDIVGADRLRGFEWMRIIKIIKPDDADFRVIYGRKAPELLVLVKPQLSAEVAGDFHRLKDVESLTIWYLDQHQAEILAQLDSFRSLKTLTIYESDLSENDLGFLSGLTSLEALTLKATPIRGSELSHLRDLPNLHQLELASTGLDDDGMEAIGRLTQIDELLSVIWNPVSDRGVEHLRSLTKLRELWLDGTDITDEGLLSLRKMADLESLYLRDTAVTDEGLPHLYHLSALKNLDLTGTKVTDEGIRKLQTALPGCVITKVLSE